MKVPTRVIGRISRKLKSNLAIYADSCTPAHRKLLGPVVLAILKASSCYVAEAARELPELGGTITAREDKILNFIHSPKLKLKALKAAHIDRLKKDLKRTERVLIYADLSDISKPYAKKMDALRIIEDYLGRWHGAEDPVRFVKQAFRLEKFLVDDMDAIRAWFFLIMVGFSLLFALSGGREILRWIMRFAEAFPKEVKFLYYRILRGFRRLLQSLRDPLTILVSRPRAP